MQQGSLRTASWTSEAPPRSAAAPSGSALLGRPPAPLSSCCLKAPGIQLEPPEVSTNFRHNRPFPETPCTGRLERPCLDLEVQVRSASRVPEYVLGFVGAVRAGAEAFPFLALAHWISFGDFQAVNTLELLRYGLNLLSLQAYKGFRSNATTLNA